MPYFYSFANSAFADHNSIQDACIANIEAHLYTFILCALTISYYKNLYLYESKVLNTKCFHVKNIVSPDDEIRESLLR